MKAAERKSVFVVQHEYEISPDRDEVKFIGVYSTRALARRAVIRLRKQPGFREIPEGFSIDKYELNSDHWVEGFIAMVGDRQLPTSALRPPRRRTKK